MAGNLFGKMVVTGVVVIAADNTSNIDGTALNVCKLSQQLL